MSYLQAIDRVQELQICFEAVGDLINPDHDAIDRGKLCQLHAVLEREMAKALDDLDKAIKKQKP